MKKTGLIAGAVLISLTFITVAFAADKQYAKSFGGDYYERDDNFNHDGYYDEHRRGDGYVYARVIDAHRIYETVRVAAPQRECYDEPVYRRSGNDSYTGIISGGIIGGVLGSQVGGGHGSDIATIAGTVLGSSIGRDLTRGNNHRYRDHEQRCETVNQYYDEQRAAGYHVTYRYRGRIYETQTDYRPGRKIRVKMPSRHDGYNH